jgi:PAS domain S-box-containing protein
MLDMLARIVRNRGNWMPYFVASIVTLGAVLALVEIDRLRRDRAGQAEREQVRREADLLRARLENQLSGSLFITQSIAAHILAKGDIGPGEFNGIARVLLEGHPSVHNIALSRGTVIAMVYPAAGNLSVVGRNYRDYAFQWPAINHAIQSGKPVLDGPVDLIQGGRGLILRDPIFLAAHGRSKFYGILSIVLDTPAVFHTAGLDAPSLPVRLAVVNKAREGTEGAVLFGDAQIFAHHPVTMNIALPYGIWQIAAEPRGGWSSGAGYGSFPFVSSILIALLVAITAFGAAHSTVRSERARAALRQLQNSATKEARRYQMLLQNASDGIVIVDDDGRFVEVNSALCQMLGYSREELIGANLGMIDQFLSPDEIGRRIKPIYDGNGTICIETMHTRKDGSLYDAEVNIRGIDLFAEALRQPRG